MSAPDLTVLKFGSSVLRSWAKRWAVSSMPWVLSTTKSSTSPMGPWRSPASSIQVRQTRSGTAVVLVARRLRYRCRPMANMTTAMAAMTTIAQPPPSQIVSACSQSSDARAPAASRNPFS